MAAAIGSPDTSADPVLDDAAKDLAVDGDVRFVGIDVTEPDSVQAAAAHIAETTGALDVLINNAGVALGGEERPPSSIRFDTIQRTLDVNFYGALRVLQAFLPLVRQAPAGRIVNVSSTNGSIGALVTPDGPLAQFPLMYAYSASKTILNSLTGSFAVELRDTPIKINSVCPGFNATDMNGHAGTRHPSEGAKVVVRAATLPADGPSGTFFDVNGPLVW
jgi:NAD(P)-dependent dehydrogenase (short-subunit alcohol dehydrogenase family)